MEASQAATEHDPAPEQSAGVSGERTITGDHGMQPTAVSDGSQDRPVATSPPPPATLSGIPLDTDRAAGVGPGDAGVTPGPVRTAEQVEEDEAAKKAASPQF